MKFAFAFKTVKWTARAYSISKALPICPALDPSNCSTTILGRDEMRKLFLFSSIGYIAILLSIVEYQDCSSTRGFLESVGRDAGNSKTQSTTNDSNNSIDWVRLPIV